MPFKPKIVGPDDLPPAFAEERQWPAEIAALAQRLEADAQRLAAAYPPRRESATASQPSLSAARRLLAPGIGAALLLVAVAVAWRTTPPTHNKAYSEPELTAVTIPYASGDAAVAAAVSVAELSGPELEALVDLVGREAETAASVSF